MKTTLYRVASIPAGLLILASVAFAQTLEVTSTGVGIGTSTPGGPLQIVTNTAWLGAEVDSHADSNGSGMLILRKARGTAGSPTATQLNDFLGVLIASGRNSGGWNTGNAGFQIWATENHTSSNQGNAIGFFTTNNGTTSATVKLMVDQNGNTGIGTTSPAYKLDVSGTARATGNTVLGATTGTTARLQVYADGSNWTSSFEVPSTGGYGQIAFRNPNGIVGSIETGGSSTSYATSSDRRLKLNIRELSGSGSIIDALKPRIFDWKTGEKDSFGFVAQELYPVFPQAVTKGDDDPDTISYQWGVDASKLVPVLTAEVKALRARVAALEAAAALDREKTEDSLADQIAELRREVSALKAR